MAILRFQTGEIYELTRASTIIGRSSASDLQIKVDGASRYHCEIRKEDNAKFVLVDMDSRNGTQVNGHDVEERRLQFGDEIKIGDFVAHFEETAPAEPKPEDAPQEKKLELEEDPDEQTVESKEQIGEEGPTVDYSRDDSDSAEDGRTRTLPPRSKLEALRQEQRKEEVPHQKTLFGLASFLGLVLVLEVMLIVQDWPEGVREPVRDLTVAAYVERAELMQEARDFPAAKKAHEELLRFTGRYTPRSSSLRTHLTAARKNMKELQLEPGKRKREEAEIRQVIDSFLTLQKEGMNLRSFSEYWSGKTLAERRDLPGLDSWRFLQIRLPHSSAKEHIVPVQLTKKVGTNLKSSNYQFTMHKSETGWKVGLFEQK